MQVEASRPVILVSADDTDQALLDLFSALERDGYAVHQASVDQYLATLESIMPDLAIVPLTAAGETLLKQLVGKSPLAILTCGTAGQTETAARSIQNGADEYFLFDPTSDSDSNKFLLSQLIARTVSENRSMVKLQGRLDAMAQDHQAAFNVQQQLLPEPQQFGDISFGYQLVPRSGMSGDSVNCFELNDGRLLFYLADVAGHGILGGVIATALTFTARRLASPEFDAEDQSSADLLVWFNRALLDLQLERHVAMFLGVISADRSSLQYSSAAHFPGTILCQEDRCLYLELGGLPLGVCETKYEARDVNLNEIFELVLFSDGVLEILPQDSLKNRENHLISLVESGSRSVSAISHQLSLEGLTEVPDDIAVLTIRRDKMTEDIKTA